MADAKVNFVASVAGHDPAREHQARKCGNSQRAARAANAELLPVIMTKRMQQLTP